MIKLPIDLHTHTVASGHAFCTLNELATRANELNMEAIAITDHGPGLPNGPHVYHFVNQWRFRNIPGKCKIFSGVEEDLSGFKGKVFLAEDVLRNLDIVLLGLHPYPQGFVMNNDSKTILKSLLTAMENPLIKGITHPVNNWFDFDIKEIVKNAKPTGTAVELNLSKIKGLEEKLYEFLELVGEFDAPLIINSDAHAVTELGNWENLEQFVDKIDMTKILNRNIDAVEEFFEIKNKIKYKEICK